MATAKKLSKAEKVRAYQAQHPTATTAQVAKATGADIGYIYAIRHKNKTIQQWAMKHISVSDKAEADEALAERITMIEPPTDNVNHPTHYKAGGVETIDFIEAKGLNYHLGNVVKYITRADHKGNRKEDLLKAQWYLDREIAKL